MNNFSNEDTMTNNETTLVMVQKYIPEVRQGDIRVMTLGDKILPYAIKKLPTNDDFKFNTHNDDFIVASGLSKLISFFSSNLLIFPIIDSSLLITYKFISKCLKFKLYIFL